MVGDSPDSPRCWTVKRRAALILSVLTGETSSLALVRKHVAKRCSQACRELRAKLFAEFGHGSAALRHVRRLQGLEDVRSDVEAAEARNRARGVGGVVSGSSPFPGASVAVAGADSFEIVTGRRVSRSRKSK